MHADFEEGTAFDVLRPLSRTAPFVFCSAHSGRHYPQRFLGLSQLDAWQIRRSEDCHVDTLFSGVAALGAPLIRAHFPRAYVDANREALELDPAMFAGPLPGAVNAGSPRVAAGLGVIPRLVGEGRAIYAARLPAQEAAMRLESCYLPFHRALKALIGETVAAFGFCVLVDCHSMPGQIVNPDDGRHPDVIIGDRFGQSAAAALTSITTGLFRQAGHAVCLNRPYAGGFITEHYGRPAQGVHALQVEVSRKLYLDESRYATSQGFPRLQAALMDICAKLVAIAPALLRPEGGAIAAE